MAGLRQSVHQGIPAELGRDTPPVAPPEVVALLHQMGSPESKLTDIPSSGTRGTGMVCFRAADQDMGSAGALVWTPLFLFCLRDGRLISGTVNIGQGGPWFSRETLADPDRRISLPDQ